MLLLRPHRAAVVVVIATVLVMLFNGAEYKLLLPVGLDQGATGAAGASVTPKSDSISSPSLASASSEHLKWKKAPSSNGLAQGKEAAPSGPTLSPWIPIPNHSNPLFPTDIVCRNETGFDRPVCKRECPNGRHNKILYKVVGGAGLNSRMRIFTFWAEIAAYLCATVHVPPPYKMLTKLHNGNIPISPDLAWTDFLNFTDHDGTIILSELTPAELKQDLKPGQLDGKQVLSSPSSKGKENKEDSQVYKTDFMKALQITMDNHDLVWEVNENFYWAFQALANYLQTFKDLESLHLPQRASIVAKHQSNPYTVQTTPYVIQRIANELWESLQDKHPASALFGSWHIRRGDSIKDCDTSTERMKRFVECTFTPDIPQKLVVLLMTDETDAKYLKALKHIFETHNKELQKASNNSSGIDVVFVDPLVREHLPGKYNNNYHLFEIGTTLAEKAKAYKFSHRRHFDCPDCKTILQS